MLTLIGAVLFTAAPLPASSTAGIAQGPEQVPGFVCLKRTGVTVEDHRFDEPLVQRDVCAKWVMEKFL